MTAIKIETTKDLEKAFELRIEVFVHEQGIPLEDEIDEFDTLTGDCQHVLAFHEGKAVGTGRIRTVDGMGKIERIVVLKSYRGLGIGKIIIEKLEELGKEKGYTKTKMHAQAHAEKFYEKLGYAVASDLFMEDGIEHYLMVKKVTQ